VYHPWLRFRPGSLIGSCPWTCNPTDLELGFNVRVRNSCWFVGWFDLKWIGLLPEGTEYSVTGRVVRGFYPGRIFAHDPAFQYPFSRPQS
jgi:hypothetical protein